MTDLNRRALLAMMAAAGVSAQFQAAFAAGAGGKKTIFVILRGAMDGVAALIPDGRDVEALRNFTLPDRADRLPLDSGFSLHPSLSGLQALYRAGEVGFIHAAATPYRDRSHFDGQDFLETLGTPSTNDGWLNRVVKAAGGEGLAVGYTLPLALRGDGAATNWSPPVFASASDDLLDRLEDLYSGHPQLAQPLAMARATTADGATMMGGRGGPAAQYAEASKALGQLMSADGGPDIGMLSFDGWDTHANQAGQFATRLSGLDAAILALKTELGAAWDNTAIVMCSEFGRTAAENGSRGTDHGTGGLMVLAGGAVRGGRVHGDWPGLRRRDLYEGRDLAPANEVTAVLKGVMRDHLGVSRAVLDAQVFPSSSRAMDGLI
ncbi:MAG: DUF1501 domain-containing protein [Pseudomonadota bacterium]